MGSSNRRGRCVGGPQNQDYCRRIALTRSASFDRIHHMSDTTGDFLKRRCSYMDNVYNFDAILEDAKLRLVDEDVEFDTLVGTGLSGALVVPRLADALDVRWMLVRKDNDGSHSTQPVEGFIGRRWLFVDDFMSTGATFRRVENVIDRICASNRTFDHDANGGMGDYVTRPWLTELVGVYAYQYQEYYTTDDARAWC